ncbi:MAG: biosynthetic-type acetolactate synthase large subunit, partial [Gammaproteobacteria bacterium]|nr:biosynthetic-type acetolactate synthase large subunit [Gammaproteobacteria bacterium]
MEQLSGGDMLIRALHDEGVEMIYGYPGGAVLHIYDAIFNQDKVEHILVRHEQAATHAADGYARATGKPGVVLVTSGPGATNAITGIATAFMDSIPMIVISGQVDSSLIGSDGFQETDMVGISRPIVKHSFMVQNPEDIPMIVKKAFHIATTGRPGPVVIDIPKDATDPSKKFKYQYPESVKLRSYSVPGKGHTGQIKKAVELLLAAKRPVLYTGGGVVQGNGSDLLRELARKLDFPVTNTLMGLGAYPATDRQFLGMLGMHGTYEANMAMHFSDVVLGIGVRFDDRVTNAVSKFCPGAKILHIDIDPASISKTVAADVPIVGSVTCVLEEMLELIKLSETRVDSKSLDLWWKQIDGWREKDSLKVIPADNDVIKPQQVIQSLYEITKGEAYVSSDVGQHQMF